MIDPIITLDSIIEKAKKREAIMFVDSSILTTSESFFQGLYKCTRYKQIDSEKVIELLGTMYSAEKILALPNTKILPEVIKEFNQFKYISKLKIN